MKKVVYKESKMTMSKLANPFPNNTLEERLVASGAIDLKDNCIIEDLGNGYARTIIIDRTKLIK